MRLQAKASPRIAQSHTIGPLCTIIRLPPPWSSAQHACTHTPVIIAGIGLTGRCTCWHTATCWAGPHARMSRREAQLAAAAAHGQQPLLEPGTLTRRGSASRQLQPPSLVAIRAVAQPPLCRNVRMATNQQQRASPAPRQRACCICICSGAHLLTTAHLPHDMHTECSKCLQSQPRQPSPPPTPTRLPTQCGRCSAHSPPHLQPGTISAAYCLLSAAWPSTHSVPMWGVHVMSVCRSAPHAVQITTPQQGPPPTRCRSAATTMHEPASRYPASYILTPEPQSTELS